MSTDEAFKKDCFYKKSERITPRPNNKYKKPQFSTLNPDFVNTNDGTVPSTQSNIVAIVNKDGSVKKTIMDSSVSLNNDGQFISKNSIPLNRPQEQQSPKNLKTHVTLSSMQSNQDNITNTKPIEKNNSLECNEFRKKISSTKKKCRRTKKQIENLLSSEKKLKTALSKHRIFSNTKQYNKSAQTQTDSTKNCKCYIDDKKFGGLNRSSEKIQYNHNKHLINNNNNNNIGKVNEWDSTTIRINCDDLQNNKKLITVENHHHHENTKRLENALKDIEILNNNIIETTTTTNNNKNKNLLLKQQTAEGENYQNYRIIEKNKNIKKFGYINKLFSIFLFLIILCWFLSVVFNMNIPQDLGKIFFRYFTSLPVFSRHKRRELTKAEIGLKWINGFLNVIKGVIGF